ncbi:winged helix DNA-binding protein [Pseudomonas sp. NFACC07-1]|uniref:winged helix DNA-binding protein n=1 Tax=Pseudomonas sp. NFACC07-1 TaxID=1566239 RepID=UPI0008C55C92|nr:winged helix DNA-binding protein [Pseudomonas sp. NFACC07-1]SEI69232.1 Winged helix DNA-binding domain-containing protein [Pseudomonas sp. NFACC07-1]
MKGIRGKVIKWSLGTLGAAGVALIAYVVEHGELPVWLSKALSALSGLLHMQAPWALWEILLAVLIPCAGLGIVIVILLQKNSVDVDDYNAQLEVLKTTNAAKIQLEKQYNELTTEHAKLLASVDTLKLSNSDLLAQNEELKKAVAMVNEAKPKDIEINDICLSVLKAIASLIERDIRAELDNIESIVGFGKIQTHAALDILIESGLVSASANVRGTRYRLTPKGRAYYVGRKD